MTRTGLAFFLAALTITASAQTRRSLTIEQAIQLGLDNSKSLHASAQKTVQADAHVSEVNAARLPSLKLSASYQRLSAIDPFTITIAPFPPQVIAPALLNNYNIQLNLAQPVFTGFRLASSSAIADRSADAARLDYEKDRRDLIFNVRTAYWNLFKASEIKNVIDSTIFQVTAHLNDVKNLQTQGMATTNDVLKVQVQLSNVKLQQIDASNAVRMASMALDNLIGLNVDTDIDIASTSSLTPRTYGETRELVLTAMKNRPDIKAMEQRVSAGEEAVTLARGGWFPQLFIIANYTYANPNQRIFPSHDAFDGTWAVGAQLTWDVWTWGTAGHQTAQAQAQLEQSRDGLGMLRDGVSLEVNQNALQLAKAKERIAVAQEGVAQAQENLRVTNDKYKTGLVLNSEVLDAEVALQQAKTNYTQAVVDFELAQAGLEKSIGQ